MKIRCVVCGLEHGHETCPSCGTSRTAIQIRTERWSLVFNDRSMIRDVRSLVAEIEELQEDGRDTKTV